jgi:hypothetical protein
MYNFEQSLCDFLPTGTMFHLSGESTHHLAPSFFAGTKSLPRDCVTIQRYESFDGILFSGIGYQMIV